MRELAGSFVGHDGGQYSLIRRPINNHVAHAPYGEKRVATPAPAVGGDGSFAVAAAPSHQATRHEQLIFSNPR